MCWRLRHFERLKGIEKRGKLKRAVSPAVM
jgi:hypothetical protein